MNAVMECVIFDFGLVKWKLHFEDSFKIEIVGVWMGLLGELII